MRRPFLALICLVLLAGCGDSVTDEQTIDADANAVTAAAERTSEQDSARVEISGTVEVNGVEGTSSGEGIVDFGDAASTTTTTVDIAGQSLDVQAVLLDGFMYMKLPPQASAGLPEGKEWAKIDFGEALGVGDALSAGSGATDPASYLKLLQGSGGVKTAGTETIGGRRTTHYVATIDYEQLADSGPEELRSLAEKSLEFSALKRVDVDVWVDDSGLIRRQSFPIETKPVGGAPAQKQTLVMDYVEYGVDTDAIQAPPDDLVVDITEQVKDQLD